MSLENVQSPVAEARPSGSATVGYRFAGRATPWAAVVGLGAASLFMGAVAGGLGLMIIGGIRLVVAQRLSRMNVFLLHDDRLDCVPTMWGGTVTVFYNDIRQVEMEPSKALLHVRREGGENLVPVLLGAVEKGRRAEARNAFAQKMREQAIPVIGQV